MQKKKVKRIKLITQPDHFLLQHMMYPTYHLKKISHLQDQNQTLLKKFSEVVQNHLRQRKSEGLLKTDITRVQIRHETQSRKLTIQMKKRKAF